MMTRPAIIIGGGNEFWHCSLRAWMPVVELVCGQRNYTHVAIMFPIIKQLALLKSYLTFLYVIIVSRKDNRVIDELS